MKNNKKLSKNLGNMFIDNHNLKNLIEDMINNL